jgi:hypothetical protein
MDMLRPVAQKRRALIKAIATSKPLRQGLRRREGTKVRIQEMGDKDSAFKPFTSWRSRTPTFDDLRERMAALIRDLPRA